MLALPPRSRSPSPSGSIGFAAISNSRGIEAKITLPGLNLSAGTSVGAGQGIGKGAVSVGVFVSGFATPGSASTVT